MFELLLALSGTLLFDALLLGFLAWAFYALEATPGRVGAAIRILPGAPIRVSRDNRLRTMAVSSTLSLVTILGAVFFLHDALLSSGPVPVWKMALQGVGILVVYDFVYYFLHRGMHNARAMRYVHGVHHRAKNPSALESFYLHPVELLAGLGLLLLSTWLIGPVHPYAFVAAFFVYSTLNILIHSGIYFQHPLLWPIDALTRKHHVHHQKDTSKNFSSLTPLPDLLFRTAG